MTWILLENQSSHCINNEIAGCAFRGSSFKSISELFTNKKFKYISGSGDLC